MKGAKIMSRIFISHSSIDKVIVKRLAIDLMKNGHDIWLDEWDIKVGECIITGIEGGILRSDFVILVLSDNLVKSNWVDNEWKSKYWEEIEKSKVMILPVLISNCDIPFLLKSRKYADFRGEYETGLYSLLLAINPIDKERLVFIERLRNIREKIAKQVVDRMPTELKILDPHKLNVENFAERAKEIEKYAADNVMMFIKMNGKDLDEIKTIMQLFGLNNDYIDKYQKYTINTLGWRKIIEEITNIIGAVEQIEH